MKRIFMIVAMTLLWIVSLSAQVPQKLTYQAVIRDAAGNVVSNQDLEVQISILQGNIEGGTVVYSETHTTATTVNGVITLEVGGGMTTYDFNTIDWSNGPFFIRSAAELNGKTISVTSQLLSVPYALYAHRSFLADKVDEKFLQDFINDRVESLLSERDAIWEGKIKELEATIDSISAQINIPPVDTIPTDTIHGDTIPTDTIPADTTPADTLFKSAAIHGVLPGKFSMGKNKIVHFSKGVLQYLAYKNEWRFAKTQFDTLGKSYLDYWMFPATDWVDCYEYGAGTANHPECEYYDRDYHYWGIEFNYASDGKNGDQPIHNGGNKIGLWENPDDSGWKYLFNFRDNADSLYSKAKVNGMEGYVLLPDDWETPSDINFTPKAENCSVNVYDKKTWEKMESLGAVFMPCANYWSWGIMFECHAMNLTANHAYPVCEDEYWCDDDFFDPLAYGRNTNFIRLVTTDSIAAEIIKMGTIENEELEGEGVDMPNNYLPDNQPDLSGVDMSAGLLRGRFSVSETKQVNFSQGNLQYNPDTKIWRFAETQIDHISPKSWIQNTTEKRDEWIDAFRWASSGYAFDPTFNFAYGDFYEDIPDISGTKYDWGVYNPISNGGNTANLWRTLTKDEWEYLMKRRKDNRNFHVAAQVQGVDGILLLPDDWDFNNGIPYNDNPETPIYNYEVNTYDEEVWSRMEALGAVFLPSAGIVRYGSTYDIDDTGYTDWIDGSYWSTSLYDDDTFSWGMLFIAHSASAYENPDVYDITPTYDGVRRRIGCSVRLVRDVKE